MRQRFLPMIFLLVCNPGTPVEASQLCKGDKFVRLEDVNLKNAKLSVSLNKMISFHDGFASFDEALVKFPGPHPVMQDGVLTAKSYYDEKGTDAWTYKLVKNELLHVSRHSDVLILTMTQEYWASRETDSFFVVIGCKSNKEEILWPPTAFSKMLVGPDKINYEGSEFSDGKNSRPPSSRSSISWNPNEQKFVAEKPSLNSK